MLNEEFLALIPGSVGEVIYQKRIVQNVPQKYKDNFVDRFVNAKMNALLMNSLSNPDPNLNPQEEFIKARELAREELEGKVGIKPIKIYIQVDQKESYDQIIKIEKEEGFMNWNFPAFIDEFKKSYLNSIK